MGGGVLAHALADAKQRVLLLERGDLLFTTHALNTTRPHADLYKKTGPTQVFHANQTKKRQKKKQKQKGKIQTKSFHKERLDPNLILGQ